MLLSISREALRVGTTEALSKNRIEQRFRWCRIPKKPAFGVSVRGPPDFINRPSGRFYEGVGDRAACPINNSPAQDMARPKLEKEGGNIVRHLERLHGRREAVRFNRQREFSWSQAFQLESSCGTAFRRTLILIIKTHLAHFRAENRNAVGIDYFTGHGKALAHGYSQLLGFRRLGSNRIVCLCVLRMAHREGNMFP